LAFCELPQAYRLIGRDRQLRIAVSSLGPSGSWWLKDRIEGKFPVLTGSKVVAAGAQGNRIELTVRADGRLNRMTTDHVMAGAGFKVDIGRIPFLARGLLAQIKSYSGYPVLNGKMETSLPGLFLQDRRPPSASGP
jgi:hypothetical protein